MKCKNDISVAYWNNGQTQILGTYGIAREFKEKINGYYAREICDGDIECSIYAGSSYDDGCGSYPELEISFRCNRCGKSYFPHIAVEDIQNLVEIHLEELTCK